MIASKIDDPPRADPDDPGDHDEPDDDEPDDGDPEDDEPDDDEPDDGDGGVGFQVFAASSCSSVRSPMMCSGRPQIAREACMPPIVAASTQPTFMPVFR